MICLWIEVIWFSSSRNDSLQKTWNLEQIDFFFTKVSIPIYHNYMEKKKQTLKKKFLHFQQKKESHTNSERQEVNGDRILIQTL